MVTFSGDTQWCSWLIHCATKRKVSGSIGIFHLLNPSYRNMTLESFRPVKEMSTRNTS